MGERSNIVPITRRQVLMLGGVSLAAGAAGAR